MSFKTIKQLMETLDTEPAPAEGKFSYRLEYKNPQTGGLLSGDWKTVDLSDEGLLSAHDIAYAVTWFDGVTMSDLDFLTDLIKDDIGFVGQPSSFEPTNYEVISEKHATVKIRVTYNLRDTRGRKERDELDREAILTFMEH